MFTGLVEALGTVRELADDGGGGKFLAVAEAKLAPELALGESVAVNGACLTVVGVAGDAFRFQVGPETLAKTNLGALEAGDVVNLERALRAGDRLGGHFVLGHVDGVGHVAELVPQGEWVTATFRCAKELTDQMVAKGSVAVDGVSLTVVEVHTDHFSVMLIPHTLQNTTLGRKGPGAAVNIETDILAKHVQRMLENVEIRI